MNIDWLRYFVTLAETKNFHSAADIIGISPPTLSKAISDLEKKYKTKLINRTHKIQGLTPEGELYLSNAINILAKIDSLKNSLEELRTGEPKGTLKVAGGGISLPYFIPPFLKSLTEKYPDIYFKTFSLGSEEIEKFILEGKIDFGFVNNPPTDKNIEFRKIADFKFIIVGKPQPKKNWDELSYIVLKFFGEPNFSTVDGWPENNYKRNVLITTETISTIIHFCETGLVAAFIPDIAVKDRIRAGHLSIVAKAPISHTGQIYLVWAKSQSNTIIISTALKIFFALFPPLK